MTMYNYSINPYNTMQVSHIILIQNSPVYCNKNIIKFARLFCIMCIYKRVSILVTEWQNNNLQIFNEEDMEMRICIDRQITRQ